MKIIWTLINFILLTFVLDISVCEIEKFKGVGSLHENDDLSPIPIPRYSNLPENANITNNYKFYVYGQSANEDNDYIDFNTQQDKLDFLIPSKIQSIDNSSNISPLSKSKRNTREVARITSSRIRTREAQYSAPSSYPSYSAPSTFSTAETNSRSSADQTSYPQTPLVIYPMQNSMTTSNSISVATQTPSHQYTNQYYNNMGSSQPTYASSYQSLAHGQYAYALPSEAYHTGSPLSNYYSQTYTMPSSTVYSINATAYPIMPSVSAVSSAPVPASSQTSSPIQASAACPRVNPASNSKQAPPDSTIYSKIKTISASVPKRTSSLGANTPCDEISDTEIINPDQIKHRATIPADPASISLAYESLLKNSQSKKYVSEDRLAFGHRQSPSNDRSTKDISRVAEEKLLIVDKPIIEFNPSTISGELIRTDHEKTDLLTTCDKPTSMPLQKNVPTIMDDDSSEASMPQMSCLSKELMETKLKQRMPHNFLRTIIRRKLQRLMNLKRNLARTKENVKNFFLTKRHKRRQMRLQRLQRLWRI